jgi:hypothetical protein
MKKHTLADVPGLFLYADYFSAADCALLTQQSAHLYRRLEEQISPAAQLQKAHIPQPAFVRSEKHNLQSEEHYTRVTLLEGEERPIRCEYFPRYGEDGHALAYFQGNANLPDFARGELLAGIRRQVEQDGLITPGQALKWKLTMNFYKAAGGRVAGFPFHVDIPSNGVVTMILNVHQPALFQIAKGDVIKDIKLTIGCVLLLSGESRHEWKHRVLPRGLDAPASPDELKRVSLVLGYQ